MSAVFALQVFNFTGQEVLAKYFSIADVEEMQIDFVVNVIVKLDANGWVRST